MRAARRPSIQPASQSRATSPTGTSRSLSPLPMTRTNAPSRREVLAVQVDRLADAQARGVQELEQRAVAECRSAGLEQALGLVDGQRLGQQARRPGQVEMGRDVDPDEALAVGEPVEALERGGAAAEAARGETGVVAAAASGPRRQVADGRIR